ncbi:glycosyl hydrolase [Natrinema halophilum]|uniref:glucan endo-1,3-beta-D-glucosidase n=1 Tax=Natrinema halophilum TaxID=1699371 RepID=A0A7D5KJP4_9EURY|nr:glycosyl hydrolase [Natrinema halophilum]QLG49619.1 hypothetical protein HYG82_12485 [Natrinema halophilum]
MTEERSDGNERSIELSRRDCVKGIGLAAAIGLAADAAAAAFSDPEVVRVGAGSYAARRPQPDSSEFTEDDQRYKYVSPSPVVHGTYLTDDAPPTPPSNTWWSHNWFTGSGHEHGGPNPTVALPWYVETTVDGLTAIYADDWLTDPGESVAERGFVKLDHRYTPRIELGHSAGGFGDSRVDDWGDFHARLAWGSDSSARMDVTLVKGSPFIFAEYGGGDAEIRFADLSGGVARPENVEVWADRGNVLGVSVTGNDTNYDYVRHFGIFAPDDATWDGVGTGDLSSSLGSGDYLSVAPLPNRSIETLDRLEDYAYNVVRDTRVSYEYAPTDANGDVVSEVRSTFEFVTDNKPESRATGSLAGLLPHQWKHTDAELTDLEYWSPRGTLKVHAGTTFETTKTYPGILPHMPDEGTYDRSTLRSYVDVEERADLWEQGVGSECSTYWIGKDFDHHLRTIPIAQHVGDTPVRDRSLDALRTRLEGWLTVQDTSYGTTEEEEAFTYWDEFGSLIGYPAEFYSSDFLNDHHLHYGYFVKVAAELARHDGDFVDEYGEMVDLLVREYANWERPTSDSIDVTTPRESPADAFPHLRTFDAYEGHSWASGFPLGDGANQESSSESMVAHASVIMWAEHRMATADGDDERATYREMRDTAIVLYTEEMHAIWEYWFDTDDDSHPDDWGANLAEDETAGATGAPDGLRYDAYEYASIIWGDGYHRQTFWGQTTMEEIWGINWLPIDGHSFYLNWDETYADANWNRMVEARGGDTDFLEGWHTPAIGYRALSDPGDAVDIADTELPIGRKSAYIYHWVHNLNAMGTPTQAVVADVPQAAVFEDSSGDRTYVAYNAGPTDTTVAFSDGYELDVPANALKTSTGDVTYGLRDVDSEDPTQPGNTRGSTQPGGSDDQSPPAPTNLSAPGTTATTVTLDWDASSATDVAHYVVFVDGTVDHEVAAGTTDTTVGELSAGITSEFAVSAVDDAGNESGNAGPITVTTEASADPGDDEVSGDGWSATLSETSATELRVEFDHDAGSSWVDLHYTVTDRVQQNVRMFDQGGSHTYTVDGLSVGDRVRYFFTYEASGAADTTATYSYSVSPADH